MNNTKDEKIEGGDEMQLPEDTATAPLFTESFKHHLYPNVTTDEMPEVKRVIHPLVEPSLTEYEVKAAVKKHISGKAGYTPFTADEMRFTSVKPVLAYVYNLQSFTERRVVKWLYDPQSVPIVVTDSDSDSNSLPDAWSIHVPALEQWFQKSSFEETLPQTTGGKSECKSCSGVGKKGCTDCSNMGSSLCPWCKGSGAVPATMDPLVTDIQMACKSCSASGRNACKVCQATGFIPCLTCKATGNVKYYVHMEVKRDILSDHFISNSCDSIADKIMIQAEKRMVFAESGDRVTGFSASDFPDQAIVTASNLLVKKHMDQVSGSEERIIRMKQMISGLPITVVDFEMRGKTGRFYVYGDEKKVLFDSYPPTDCCIS